MDGQIEVVNRKIVQLLRGYCGKHPKFLYEYLEYIQHEYNREIHSSINNIPFKNYFSYLPPSPFHCVFGKQKDEDDSLEKGKSKLNNLLKRLGKFI